MKVRDVVLLHGWGYDSAVWRDLAARLAPRLRVHVPDLPGYGPDAACSPASVRQLARAMARTAPRRCHVVGWSLGGEVALAWALGAPRQVARLVLIATTPCFTRRPGWPCAIAASTLAESSRALAADRAGTLGRFVGAQGKGDSRRRQVTAALHALLAADAPDRVLASGLAALAGADLRRDLRRITQPVLVLHGAHDRIVSPVAGRRLAAMLPDARFRLLRSCAHAPFLSRPRPVATLLRDFLHG